MKNDALLAEFPGVDTSEWERVIREDLKGADYARILRWKPEEGLDLKPYYRAEDLDGIEHLRLAPGEPATARRFKASGDWRIREKIDLRDPAEANQCACKAIAEGAEEIAFSNPTIATATDLNLELANLDEIPVCLERADRNLMHLLIARFREKPRAGLISTNFDPLGDPDFAAGILKERAAGFIPFSISAAKFHEQGSTAAEEIGLALAAGVDFLAAMQERGLGIEQVADSLTFSFAVGPEFLLQIAKLRAFRLVWAHAVESFGGRTKANAARIHARTATWNQTVYDPHVNILRATTEAMSAIFGGADSIEISVFDACYRNLNETSRRLARNTQLILKREADLARVADPGGGSYSLETLTDAIARQAWQLLQQIESKGGYRSALAEGTIDSVLSRRRVERECGVATRKRVLTGTNRFVDPFEAALARIGNGDSVKTGRAAEPFERLRLGMERHAIRTGKKPRILLAEVGSDRKWQTARSNFAADFLACAGLESRIVRFQRAEGMVCHDSDLIVLCSADAEYLSIAAALFERLNASASATPVLVAGIPDTVDQLRALGVAEFIPLRCNAVETLENIQRLLGIKD